MLYRIYSISFLSHTLWEEISVSPFLRCRYEEAIFRIAMKALIRAKIEHLAASPPLRFSLRSTFCFEPVSFDANVSSLVEQRICNVQTIGLGMAV